MKTVKIKYLLLFIVSFIGLITANDGSASRKVVVITNQGTKGSRTIFNGSNSLLTKAKSNKLVNISLIRPFSYNEENWFYHTSTDEMTGIRNVTAYLRISLIEPQLKYDHVNPMTNSTTGGVWLSLELVKAGKVQNATIRVATGANTIDTMPLIEGSKVLIRFDNSEPSYYRLRYSSDFNRTGDINIEQASTFIGSLKRASLMRIQFKLRGEFSQIVRLNVKGLKF